MRSTLPVLCADGDYAAAVAELPLRTRRSSDAAGAVAVIPGDGDWCDGVRLAVAAGAAAVIVSHPGVVPAADVQRLSAQLGSLPVILERPLFRSDAAADAAAGRGDEGSEVRLVAVDGGALAAELGVVLRDAIAWARVLTGGPLAWQAASGGLALSDGVSSPPAALNIVTVDAGGSWIRAQALGVIRSEVEADVERIAVTTAGDRGRVAAPARYEAPQRLALRRALDARAGGHVPPDLADLAADALFAEQMTLGESL